MAGYSWPSDGSTPELLLNMHVVYTYTSLSIEKLFGAYGNRYPETCLILCGSDRRRRPNLHTRRARASVSFPTFIYTMPAWGCSPAFNSIVIRRGDVAALLACSNPLPRLSRMQESAPLCFVFCSTPPPPSSCPHFSLILRLSSFEIKHPFPLLVAL